MILISGASSGIGKACAESLAKHKKNLFLVARRSDRLEKLKSQLETQYSVRVEIARLDVSCKSDVEAFAKKHAESLDKLEALVNNAGLAVGRALFQEGSLEDWEKMLSVNINGVLYLTHQVLPVFLKRGRGHILNLGSVASRWVYPRGNIYCATKRAVSALTESLRLDLLGTNIRVTEISPGMVETEFSEVRLGGDKESAKKVYEGMTPLSPEDIAEAVVWSLMRPSHVNIQEIVIYPTDQASTSLVHRKESR